MAVGARPLVPSRLAPGGVAHGSRRTPTSRIGGFVALTKPRIIELLLITTVPTMVLAEQGLAAPPGWCSSRCIGGTLAAGGANAINMVVDRDIDKLMPRTQGRPLVTGLVQPREALVFAIAPRGRWPSPCCGRWANLLSAVLALSATLFYVFVYTLWLKRTSTQNIVIGGAAGAVPVLVGWAAVQNNVTWTPVVLFVVMFLWTPPHFWALAIRYADDYRAADVPDAAGRGLAGGHGPQDGALHGGHGGLHAGAVARRRPRLDLRHQRRRARALFLWGTIDLGRNPTPQRSMRVFGYSITYVTLLFAAMTIDVFVRHGCLRISCGAGACG